MTERQELWRTPDKVRAFLLPATIDLPPGSQALRSLTGADAAVDPVWAIRFEVPDDVARQWAERELRGVLAEARDRIEHKLAAARESIDAARRAPAFPPGDLTPDAMPAIGALIRKLPGVIAGSLSGDVARVAEARGAMADLQWRLDEAGIRVDERFGRFPERLAALRETLARPRDR